MNHQIKIEIKDAEGVLLLVVYLPTHEDAEVSRETVAGLQITAILSS